MGAARSAGGLRGELTEFVGRRAELAQVRDALAGARLVTLTGPGGIGKTRLALQVAAGAGRAFRDGVWLAELTGLRDPGLLVAEVARSLGLSDKSARWAVASLADYLQARQLLLVLDGCEHLADACAVMADVLLRGCPGAADHRDQPARARGGGGGHDRGPADDGAGRGQPERAGGTARIRGGAVVRRPGSGRAAGLRRG